MHVHWACFRADLQQQDMLVIVVRRISSNEPRRT